MKAMIEQKELLRLLQDVAGAVPARTTQSAYQHVCIEAAQPATGADATLTIKATNGEISISLTGKADAVEAGSTILYHKSILQLVRGLSGPVRFQTTADGGRALVESGSTRASLVTFPAENWPVVMAEIPPEAAEWRVRSGRLGEAIRRTIFAVGTSEMTGSPIGAWYIRAKDGYAVAVGCDRHRMATWKGLPAMPDEIKSVLISPGAAQLVAKVLPRDIQEEISVFITGNLFFVKTPDAVVMAVMLHGDYPDYEKILLDNPSELVAFETETLVITDVLKRLDAVIADSDSHRVSWSADAYHVLKIAASNPNVGDIEEQLPGVIPAVAFDIGCNSRYLLEALAVTAGNTVEWQLAGLALPITLRDLKDPDWSYLVMPVRKD